MTVSVPGDYVSKYSEANGEHALDPEGQVEAYIRDLELVRSEDGVWGIKGGFQPAEYTVSCEESESAAPTPDQVADLLDTTAVRVKCVREGSGHEFIDYALESDTYSIEVGKVSGSKVQATVKVSDPSYYVDRFCDNTGTEHRLDPEEQSEKAETINLAYLEGQGWYLDGGYSPVTYTVTCDAGTITVTPADMTIYEGGESGYEGVVNGDGNEVEADSLPEPMYEITATDGIDPEGMTISNGDNSWTVTATEEENLYTLKPVDNSDDVRIQYKDGDKVVTDDEFSATEDSFNELTTTIFDGDTDPSATAVNGETYNVEIGEGTLTVRAVDEPDNEATLTEVTNNAPQERLAETNAVAVADANTEYTLNDTDVVVDDKSGISLLFDSIIDDEVNRTQLLNDEIVDESYIGDDFKSEIRYLDLVDNHNGNAWVKSSEGVDIYWAYPKDTDKNTDFKILHFSGLHRDGDKSGFNPDDITDTTLVDVTDQTGTAFEKTDQGIKFHVAEGNFSPYALVWNYEDKGGSNPGGDGGGQTTYYKIEASAGDNGSINPSGTQTVAKGGSETFTFTPDEGYTVGNVTVDGVSVGRRSSYTFTNVQADHTISVTFMQGSTPADPDDTGVYDWLNTTDHLAFLNGYGDGTGLFGPENNMTRGEAAQMFYNMLLDKTPGDIEVNFEDLDENAFYYEPVMVLASHGIIKGTSPTTFEPTRPIARAEFVAMAMRFSNGEAEVSENIFVDVADDAWYRDYVLGAVSYGWIYGYQDGSHRFGPTDTIRCSEAAAVANRMLGRVADGAWINAHEDELKLFPDVPRSHWGFFEIVEATNSHDYEKDGSFENWTGLKK